jgi:hypothetical protein
MSEIINELIKNLKIEFFLEEGENKTRPFSNRIFIPRKFYRIIEEKEIITPISFYWNNNIFIFLNFLSLFKFFKFEGKNEKVKDALNLITDALLKGYDSILIARETAFFLSKIERKNVIRNNKYRYTHYYLYFPSHFYKKFKDEKLNYTIFNIKELPDVFCIQLILRKKEKWGEK